MADGLNNAETGLYFTKVDYSDDGNIKSVLRFISKLKFTGGTLKSLIRCTIVTKTKPANK